MAFWWLVYLQCGFISLSFHFLFQSQRWHPDRCSASGNSNFVEEAKKKFQAIQEAYSGNFPFNSLFCSVQHSNSTQKFVGFLRFNALVRVDHDIYVVWLFTVLSDSNKRFMYDVGAYNSDDDENVSWSSMPLKGVYTKTLPFLRNHFQQGF